MVCVCATAVPLPPVLYLIVINATTLEARWSVSPEESNPVSGFRVRFREQGSQLPTPIVLPNSTFSYVAYNLSEWLDLYAPPLPHTGAATSTVEKRPD